MLLAELLEPVVAAAQEWLECKDSADHDAVVEARGRLLTALDESPGLAATATRPEDFLRFSGVLPTPRSLS